MKHTGVMGCIVLILFVSMPSQACARWNLDLETGAVFSGYNDVRIPGDAGTQFSLSEELETDPAWFFRVRWIYSLQDRHRRPRCLPSAAIERRGIHDAAALPHQVP